MKNIHTTIIIPYKEDRGWLSQAVMSAESQLGCKVVHAHGPGNVCENLNKALREVTTEFWCQLDEDDYLTPNSVQSRLLHLQDADFIHGRAENLYPDGRLTPYTLTNPNVTLQSCIKHNGIFGSSALYRTSLLDRFGLWDESLTTGEEWEYHLRLLSGGANLAYCPEVVYIYRRHDGQKSLGKWADQFKRREQINQIRERYETRRSNTTQP